MITTNDFGGFSYLTVTNILAYSWGTPEKNLKKF